MVVASKGFVKPFVIEVLRGGGTHKQAVVIEIADSADALVFLFGQHGFQWGDRPVVVEKGVEKEHQRCCRDEKYGCCNCKIFQKLPIHIFSVPFRPATTAGGFKN